MTWNQRTAYDFLYRTMKTSHFPAFYAFDQEMSLICATSLPEIFSPALILDLLGEFELPLDLKRNLLQSLQTTLRKDGLCPFLIHQKAFPPDVDNTSLVCTVLIKNGLLNPQKALHVVETILANVNSKGLIKTWLTLRSDRIDPVVCANALYFIHSQGKGSAAKLTEDFLYQIIENSNYSSKHVYFPSEDIYLYYLSRLFEFCDLRDRFFGPFSKRLKERMNTTENPLDLAARVICAKRLGIECEEKKLVRLQKEDGGWPCWALVQSVSQNLFSGSRQLTTAFAIRALQEKYALW